MACGCRNVSSLSAPAEPERPAPPARGRSLLAAMRSLLVRVRDRSPLADRTVRAVDDYLDAQGSLLSAGMTYYGFLAIFPLVAVALGVASVLSRVVPSVERTLRENLGPGWYPTPTWTHSRPPGSRSGSSAWP